MKPFLSIFGGDAERAESILPDTAIFPNGTPSREIESRGEPAAVARRSAGGFAEQLERIFGGANQSGTYSPREAYALSPWMQPAIHAFAGALAAREFQLWDRDKEVTNHWLLDLMARPNKTLRMTQFQLFYFTFALWRYAGEVFWQLEYDGQRKPGEKRGPKARPTNIWVWNKEAVEPKFDDRTKEFLGWIVTYDGVRGFVDRLDMVHFPVFDPTQHNPKGPSRGSSLWKGKGLPLTNEIQAHKWNREWWGRGIAPSIAFVDKSGTAVGDDVKQEQDFLDKMKAKLAGKNGEPMVLVGEWLIQQLEASQRDAQFVEGMAQNRDAILAGNTPPIVLGDDEANYANASAQIKAWWTFDLIPAATFLCSCIDTAFIYDEARLWTKLSTDDVDELQEAQGVRIDKFVQLINAGRCSPKVAAQIVGLEIDPTMPGYDAVLVGYNQIPYGLMEEGASVMVKEEPVLPADTDDPKPGVETEPPPPADDPKEEKPPVEREPERMIRIIPNDTPIRIVTGEVTRANDDTDELTRLILEIIRGDDEKLKKLAKKYQLQAIETGAKQIRDLVAFEALLALDDPRVTRFLEEKGNQIVSVNKTTAEKILKRIGAGIEAGEGHEEIAKEIKDLYNLRDRQARVIARHETGSSLNGGRFMQMTEEDVQRHEWLSSRDDRVRDSHKDLDGQVVEVGEAFTNGLEFPQDPNGEPSETIGCRCLTLPATSSRSTRALDRDEYWKRAIGSVRTIETTFNRKLQAYLYDQRKRVLEAAAEVLK